MGACVVSSLSAAVNTHIEIFVWGAIFIPLGYPPRSGNAGSYSDSAFNLLRSCQALFHCGCTIYIPTSSVRRFRFLHILVDTCYCLVNKGRKARVGQLERVLPKELRPQPRAPWGPLGESPRRGSAGACLPWPVVHAGSHWGQPGRKSEQPSRLWSWSWRSSSTSSHIANTDVWPFRS